MTTSSRYSHDFSTLLVIPIPPLESPYSIPSSHLHHNDPPLSSTTSHIPSSIESAAPNISVSPTASSMSNTPPVAVSPILPNPYSTNTTSNAIVPHSTNSTAPSNTHAMVTRSKNGIWKPKTYLSEFLDSEPSTVKDSLRCAHWRKAMQQEYDALITNKTWDLISMPKDKKVIGCKWVFKIKRNSDGSISRYKARLVAKGFHQVADIDYSETFSPVIKPVTIRVLLTLALANNWVIRQLDINNAFLHGLLTKEVLMEQPCDFCVSQSTTAPLVCKLKKTLYGLKQAPRAWSDRLKDFLFSVGFTNSKADTLFSCDLHLLIVAMF